MNDLDKIFLDEEFMCSESMMHIEKENPLCGGMYGCINGVFNDECDKCIECLTDANDAMGIL